MYNPIEHELGRERREAMLRGARMNSLAKAARRNKRRDLRAAVAWELQRYGGTLSKILRRL